MSAIEDRLREAYQARAEQLTETRLDALAAQRQRAALDLDAEGYRSSHTDVLPVLPATGRPNRSHRWLAPVLATAAAIALAVGVAAVVQAGHSNHPRPNPPASGASTPPSTPSKPSSSPSATGRPTGTGPAAAPYLGAGKTGSRAQVPWSQVGTGWRLVQPVSTPGGTGTAGSSLYLYDPAEGRYLITDQLPAKSQVVGWSPDGQRAMLTLGVPADQMVRFGQLELTSGAVTASFSQFQGSFIAYTRPRGLAALVYGQVQGSSRLLRYGTDGTLQLPYPAQLPGLGSINPGTALYTPDGSMLIIGIGSASVLLGNDGSVIRTYPRPAGTSQSCSPLKLWTADSFLQDCARLNSQTQTHALYLQPINGSAPTLLATSGTGSQPWGYDNDAWPLSNGDVLLSVAAECSGLYRILRPDGSTVPLVLPSGVPQGSHIVNMQGDRATFLVRHAAPSGCGGYPDSQYSLLDYDMVTGQSRRLLDRDAAILNFPSIP